MNKSSLNGFWDILPIYSGSIDEIIPTKGWIKNRYIVPSPWNKSLTGVRKKGEKYFREIKHAKNPDLCGIIKSLGKDPEFLFDGFNYPLEWTIARNAWLKREFVLSKKEVGHRYFIKIEAASPRFALFLNGKKCTEHYDPTLPLECDITEKIYEGKNQLAVLIQDHLYDKKGRTLAPSGNMFTRMIFGIWQDTWLIEKNEIYVADCRIITSTRKEKIFVHLSLKNCSNRKRTIKISPSIYPWDKKVKNQTKIALQEQIVELLPDSQTEIYFEKEWKDAKWWTPDAPFLYVLENVISEDSKIIEIHQERFGFREVWLSGKDIFLNDHPVHLFSDWGHKTSPFHLTERWIRKWYQMIKDCNMNHSRFHTHPHPKIFLELADEMGIMITGETAIHGSGGDQGADSEQFWDRAKEHIKNFVKRDKNHPSIILWSVENEMRWNGDETKLSYKMLPEMRKLFNQLDPTRPVYHEGDSSLWDEKEQDIISRHYGKECAGEGWWDRSKPLHSGEMCVYHYAGPNNTLHIAGDSVFADYDQIDKASAIDNALIIESARANGVCCLGPWNISCHQNLRLSSKKIKINYKDLNKPGIKPLQVQPYSSEFEFWKQGKGYYPNHSFEIQKRAFRPFAIIDKSLKSAYFAGSEFSRNLFLVNDTPAETSGKLKIFLKDSKGSTVFFREIQLNIPRGEIQKYNFNFLIPKEIKNGKYNYEVIYQSSEQVYDRLKRSIFIKQKASHKDVNFDADVAVIGNGYLKDFLKRIALDFAYFATLEDALNSGRKILIAEKNSLSNAQEQREKIEKFCLVGGRLIVLEQFCSIFPSMPLESKAVMSAFTRAPHHPVLKNIKDENLCYWGEDSYANPSGDANVAEFLYKKSDEKNNICLIDSGEGGFGDGDLEYSALFEAKIGDGLLLACQMKICDKISTEPFAEKLLLNILKRSVEYKPEAPKRLYTLEQCKKLSKKDILKILSAGNIILAQNVHKNNQLKLLSKFFDLKIKLKNAPDEYQAIRTNHPLNDGISNWDACGIEKFCYSNPKTTENFKIGFKFIEPTKSIEPLLLTANRSALKELFVYGGRTELLRSHTVSKFIYSHKKLPPQLIVAGCKKIGKGYLIISQFAPERDRIRIRRVLNRMLENAGIRHEGNILQGEFSESNKRSDGFPTKVYILNRNLTDDELKKIISSTVQGRERLLSTAIFEIPGWKEINSATGTWSSEGLDLSKSIYLYHHIYSPTTRKNISSNLGIPNPEALTFLDISGEGKIQITINGESYPEIELSGDNEKTLPDIPLEIYFNHFLAKWTPLNQKSWLKFRWRNIMRKPETSFGF